METHPDLAATIHHAIAAGVDGLNGDMMLAVDPTPVFTAIQPDNLDAEIAKPAKELPDKVLFIVNNLAPSNFDMKLTEMKDHFDDAYGLPII